MDLFPVDHELRLSTLHLNAELVRRVAARVSLRHGVARRPLHDRGRPRLVTRAPADRVHAVDRAHQEIGVGLTGIGEALAADEDAECFGMGRILHLGHLGDDVIIAGDRVTIAPVDGCGADRGMQAIAHARELHVVERRRLSGLTVGFGAHVPAGGQCAAASDGMVWIALRHETRGRGEKQEDRRSGHKTHRHQSFSPADELRSPSK